MHILIFSIGVVIGIILKVVIDRISYSIVKSEEKTKNVIIPIICGITFEISFLRVGFNIILAKVAAMTAILIIISFVDIKCRIIPDFMVIIVLIIGLIFSFITRNSIIDTVLGMISGGGIMFLLALIPNAMGGGDVKFMFAIGSFLGLTRTLWALLLSFIISSIISVFLILFKIKGTKDYIPFAPFLSLGSFISTLIFI